MDGPIPGFVFVSKFFLHFLKWNKIEERREEVKHQPKKTNRLQIFVFFILWDSLWSGFFFLFWPFRKLKKNSLPICRILESIQCILYENIHSIYRMECILRFVCWYHDDDTNFNYSPIITSIITYNKHMHVIIKHIFLQQHRKWLIYFFPFHPSKRQIYFSGHWLYWLSIDFFVCLLYVLII